MKSGYVERIELGRRDYSNNIFAKTHFSNLNEWQPMMINPDGDIHWQNHVCGDTLDVPGGVLYYNPGTDCDCLTNALRRFDTFNDEVDRIADEYNTDFLECKAAMYLQAYQCKPHEAAAKMDIDDPREVHELAKQFEKENCDETFVNTPGNSVIDAMRFR